ncbi:MAG: DUF2520 domain-containing protein [Clostridiales Family XIII bacterium]|jgi:predicted short-subunit dehydrogenase-like oxidoreductase (DUF2520 family)|nr:DUF2520 domain-containing protein [Clostridiales Family XIII bacterium]
MNRNNTQPNARDIHTAAHRTEDEKIGNSLPSATFPLRVGFIGAGKAGTSFGKYIATRIEERGDSRIRLSGYFSRSEDSAKSAAKLTGSAYFATSDLLADACDLVFFSVPDGEIEHAFANLIDRCSESMTNLEGKMFAHLSGSRPSDIFRSVWSSAPQDDRSQPPKSERLDSELCVFSLHPACAIPNRETAWNHLREACFVFEGDSSARRRSDALLELIGNPVGEIHPNKKALYHAACVFLSNFSVALAAEGVALLASCGIDSDISSGFLRTLFLGNAENVAKCGPTASLTGPAERGDAGTIQKHREAISDLEDEVVSRIYRDLTEILLRIAREKHPTRDYTLAFEAIGNSSEIAEASFVKPPKSVR